MSNYTDSELLQQFRNEQTKHYAFNMLMRKYQQKVYYHIRRMVIDHDDANDLVQTTFIKAWKGLENFREDSQVFTWLYRIATNECLTHLNNKKKRFFLPIGDVEHELTIKLDSEPSLKANQLEMKLQKAILSLPEKQRTVFNLRYYDEMKYEQMSEVLGTSVGALKASYHHAVQKIEKYITGN
ncbi:MAG TPA: sigma-70 family RNA polymerase sigma factor [Bacteroidia bacterium]|nr:sigma-70 family RNA polymerase sigma factor [Bacteroidia bacterium]HNU32667.1 sigma-70 family RNA polymerase sigma factor [Bacteroidia bacterium]